MQRFGKFSTVLVGALVAVLLLTSTVLADPGGGWPTAGSDLQNTRYQKSESKISPSNVGTLAPKWAFTTGGDVSATPAVDGTTVYVPDWVGNLYAIDRKTGQQVWKVKISDITGVPGDKARVTPALAGDKVIVGTQGTVLAPPPNSRPGGWALAFNKNTGALLWKTQADNQGLNGTPHPAAIITQSATVFGNRVYVGVSSLEEALAAFDQPGQRYQLTFRGSMLALRPEHRSHRVEDVHGAGGLHRQCRVGQQPGHRHQAQAGLHRHRQQLFGAAVGSRLCDCSRI